MKADSFCTGMGRRAVVVVELPAFWVGSDRGESAAESGNLVKLAMIAGSIFTALAHWETILVPPIAWKGTLKKDLIKPLVRSHIGSKAIQRLGLESMPDHVWDAVGIGEWALEEIENQGLA